MTTQLEHTNTNFSEQQFPITIICDHISSAANIGAIFRLADAFGVEKVIFVGKEPVFTRRMEKTARATHKTVLFEHLAKENDCIELLKKEKYTIVALEITNNSIPINNLKISSKNKTAIIIGNENYGVSKSLLSIANHTTHIEMFGKNSSMNLAQATAICLYEVTNNYQL